ncbi:hypothetical protein [Roseiconus lacunae]|uniref:hypothetical protein n=1 Tax=Roseiconus lacunae TaxID=2605694 RepID=UPI001E38AFEE|nr:hypothetical protein [Roseiconus lacunae]MCD0460593.1 hypothetical protein [Roseiconus lacunae]
MEHKAFIFDYESFEQELRMTLEVALTTGDCDALLSFISNNKESLSDPYEGEPLDDDCKRMIEIEDAHQYGDFSLTRNYSPQKDIGLGSSWNVVQELLASLGEIPISPIRGLTIGPASEPFDPGKAGSYFQIAERVQESLASLEMHSKNASERRTK